MSRNTRPMYWGGMILGDINSAYKYENDLKKIVENRYKKYSNRWSLFLGMHALYEERKRNRRYNQNDLHYLPKDPLVYINEEALVYEFLLLKSRKLNILKLEVYKFYRRKGYYPVPGLVLRAAR